MTCTYSKKKTFPLLSYSFCQPGGSSKKITENIYCGLNLICQQNFQSNIHLSQSEMKGNYGKEIGLKNWKIKSHLVYSTWGEQPEM